MRTITASGRPSLQRIMRPARSRSDLEMLAVCMMEMASASPRGLLVAQTATPRQFGIGALLGSSGQADGGRGYKGHEKTREKGNREVSRAGHFHRTALRGFGGSAPAKNGRWGDGQRNNCQLLPLRLRHFPRVTCLRFRFAKRNIAYPRISASPLGMLAKQRGACLTFASSRRWHSWGMLSRFQCGDVGGREPTCLEGGLAIKA